MGRCILFGGVGRQGCRAIGAARGGFGLLGLVDERCGGVFDHIDDVLAREERKGFMARYKAAAGFAIETLNAAPQTITPGQRATVL